MVGQERRLDLRAACSSMFDCCVRRLEMSEGAAYRRITAARLVRRFSCLLAVIERGELHLSTLVLLRPHLNDTNVEELVASVKGKTHREVEEQLARIAPRVDAPVCATVQPRKAGRVARAVRRAVFERDGEQCTFRDHDGARCPSRALLELDHITSRALGGSDEPSNLRVRCRAHNRLHAEEVFGKEHVARHIDLRCRRSPSVDRPADAPLDLAMRGLLHLGFASAEARRALDDVARRHQSDLSPPPIEQVLREAVTALT